jgi:hypothetical protein
MSLEPRKLETVDDLIEIAQSLEQDLGLPDRFLQTVRKSDDWSFIIKIHALSPAFAGLEFLGDVIPGLRSLRSLTRG